MNLKRLFVLFLFVATFLFSQTEKIPIASKSKVIKLKPEKTIEFDEDSPVANNFMVIADKIYFLNTMENTLSICDLNGQVIKSLNSKGKGPGEFMMPTHLFNDTKDKRIGVVDQLNKRISYFDYDGNHIKDETFQYTKIPMDIKYIGDDKIFFYMGIAIDKKNRSVLSKPTIELIKKDTAITLYSESFNPLSMNIGNSKIPIFQTSKDRIYIAKLSPESYKIEVFDKNGNHIKTYFKQTKKVKRTEEEIKEIEEKLNQAKKQAKAAGSKMELDFKGYRYANLINNFLVDNKGNLWVFSLDKNGYFFDVIDKNGKVIKKVVTIAGKSFPNRGYVLSNSKLFELIGNQDTNYTLNIYNID